MAPGTNRRDNERVVGFVRRQEMDAEGVWRAQSVSSGWLGLPPSLTAEWSYNDCHASSRQGIERMPSRSRCEESTAAVMAHLKALGKDKSLATVGLIYSEVLAAFLDRIEVSKSSDSDSDSIEEYVKESVSIAKM